MSTVHYISCSTLYISVQYNPYLSVVYFLSQCITLYISVQYTLYLSTVHFISKCSALYISVQYNLYPVQYTLYLSAIHCISQCPLGRVRRGGQILKSSFLLFAFNLTRKLEERVLGAKLASHQ